MVLLNQILQSMWYQAALFYMNHSYHCGIWWQWIRFFNNKAAWLTVIGKGLITLQSNCSPHNNYPLLSLIVQTLFLLYQHVMFHGFHHCSQRLGKRKQPDTNPKLYSLKMSRIWLDTITAIRFKSFKNN